MFIKYATLVIFIFNQKKLMRYVNMRYVNMNINIYVMNKYKYSIIRTF